LGLSARSRQGLRHRGPLSGAPDARSVPFRAFLEVLRCPQCPWREASGSVGMKSDSFPAPLPDTAGDRGGLTQTEHAIGRIWQRRFGLEVVSPGDHFFALGGDWMTAVGMIGEVEGL